MMNSHDNKPKYLWAFIGYSFFTGLLAGFVVNPVLEQVTRLVGVTSSGAKQQIFWVINMIVGFVVFRFFAWYFVARPQVPVGSESKTKSTQ